MILRRYVHGPGIDEPVVWYEGSGTSDRRWLVQDRLGSVIAVTDGAGAATSVNTYDEYGVPGSSNAGRFQYTGQMWIAEAGLYHYKARAYAPGLGRFLQSDPILYAGGLNLYAYVGNDPLNFVDPNGQIPVLAIIVVPILMTATYAALVQLYEESKDPIPGISWESVAGAALGGAATAVVGELTVATILTGDVPAAVILAGATVATGMATGNALNEWNASQLECQCLNPARAPTTVSSPVLPANPSMRWHSAWGWMIRNSGLIYMGDLWVEGPDGEAGLYCEQVPGVVCDGPDVGGGSFGSAGSSPDPDPTPSASNQGSVCRRFPRCPGGV